MVRNYIPVIGVVFRGHLWLDGIIMCVLRPNQRANLPVLAHAITQSKQYSQIRAVILSPRLLTSRIRIGMAPLANTVGLPVMCVGRRASDRTNRSRDTKRKRSALTNHLRIRIGSKYLSVLITGINDPAKTREILTLACATNSQSPEVVRVAELIADHIPRPNILQNAEGFS